MKRKKTIDRKRRIEIDFLHTTWHIDNTWDYPIRKITIELCCIRKRCFNCWTRTKIQKKRTNSDNTLHDAWWGVRACMHARMLCLRLCGVVSFACMCLCCVPMRLACCTTLVLLLGMHVQVVISWRMINCRAHLLHRYGSVFDLMFGKWFWTRFWCLLVFNVFEYVLGKLFWTQLCFFGVELCLCR